jgi:hypothetical protein
MSTSVKALAADGCGGCAHALLEQMTAIGYTQARAEVKGTGFAVNILLRR